MRIGQINNYITFPPSFSVASIMVGFNKKNPKSDTGLNAKDQKSREVSHQRVLYLEAMLRTKG